MAKGSDKTVTPLRLVSWNVNGLRACAKKGFLDFFQAMDADIFAIQETKMQEEQLEDFLKVEGYTYYMNCAERKGYSGTMVYVKKEPLSVTYDIEGDDSNEGRVITLEYPDFYFVCAYVPNSKEGLTRIDFREQWEDALRNHLMHLDQVKPVIYTGDLNVAHNEIDLKNPDSNHNNAGFSDQERAKFNALLQSGFTDSFRSLHPDTVKYSWWSYRFHAREKGIGWRIDYFIVSNRLMEKVTRSDILDDVEGSDHCPVVLEVNL